MSESFIHRFSDLERKAVYRVIASRRDMRHFRSDPVNPETLKRLLMAAHQAPSVGLMQPWRIIRITQPKIRQRISQLVEAERIATAQALGERQQEFMKLKVEGVGECGELLIAVLKDARERQIFGRRTLPEMDLASVACAIQNLWLAARAEGLGMGWVSLFDPSALAELLHIPEGAKPVAILCLGHVDEFYSAPMLEQEDWAKRCTLEDVYYEDEWGKKPEC
jgi:5,6-dimethylbenzimidazole synthase